MATKGLVRARMQTTQSQFFPSYAPPTLNIPPLPPIAEAAFANPRSTSRLFGWLPVRTSTSIRTLPVHGDPSILARDDLNSSRSLQTRAAPAAILPLYSGTCPRRQK